jgi:hypothetical protein
MVTRDDLACCFAAALLVACRSANDHKGACIPPEGGSPTVIQPELDDAGPTTLYPGPRSAQDALQVVLATQNGTDVTASLGQRIPLSSPVILDFGREVSGQLRLQGRGTVRLLFSEGAIFRETGDSTGSGDGGSFDPSAATRPDPPTRLTLSPDSLAAPSKQRGGFRYVSVSDGGGDAGTSELVGAELQFDAHTFDPEALPGAFRSTDAELDRAYWCGVYTASLCVVQSGLGAAAENTPLGAAPELVVDGAKRDRLLWAGDLVVTDRTLETVSGDFAPVTDTLRTFAHSQSNGQIPGVLPSEAPSLAFLEYTTWWVIEWADHVRRRQDIAFGHELYPQVLSALGYLRAHTDTSGLLSTTLANGINWSFSVLRLGITAYQNVLYLMALEAFVDTAKLLGEDPGPDAAGSLRSAIMSNFWDDHRGVFVDLLGSDDHVSEDANSLALLTDLVTGEQAKSVLDYLRQNHWVAWGSTNVDVPYTSFLYQGFEEHNKRVFPFIDYFEVEARLRWGDGAGALALVRRTWGSMLASSAGNGSTFWEWAGPDGNPEYAYASLAHGWSSGITALLGWDLVGARMEGKAVVLRPSNVPLARYQTTLPLAGGPLTADVSFTAPRQRLNVSTGPGVLVDVWNGPTQAVTLNGVPLDVACVADSVHRVEVDVLRVGPMTPPFTLEFTPRPPL